jgi:hypothetical protein
VKRVAIAIAAVALAAGCRAVLGIEELDLGDAGADAAAANDGGSDASTDAAGDVRDERPPPPPDSGDGCNAKGPQCRECCRIAHGDALGRFQARAFDAGCLCGPCATDCGPSWCASPSGPPPSMACGGCIDMAITNKNPPCGKAGDDCAQDPTCAAAVTCLRGCP